MGPLTLILLIGAACVLLPVAIVVATLLRLGRLAGAAVRAAGKWLKLRQPPPTSTRLTDAELASSAPIVYFIHGTFAPGAPWTAADAKVATAIAGALRTSGDAPVLQRIEWSGANTVAARLAAIGQMEDRLEGIFAVHPGRRVFLVGHSHGGGVAIKAAERFRNRGGLAIVTLATPFIIAQLRDDADALGSRLRALMYACLASLCAIPVALLPFPWLLLPATAAVVSMVLTVRAILPRPPDGPTTALLRSVPDLAAVTALIPRTLVVSRSGDEADGILKLASYLNGVVAKAVRESALADELAHLMDDARRMGEERVHRAASGEEPRALPTLAQGRMALGYVRRMRALGPEMVGVLAGMALLEMLRVAVGTSSGLLATTAVVTSSETPPGEWRHVQTLASVAPTGTVMSHSQIYDDPYVCALVADWVLQRSRPAAMSDAVPR